LATFLPIKNLVQWSWWRDQNWHYSSRPLYGSRVSLFKNKFPGKLMAFWLNSKLWTNPCVWELTLTLKCAQTRVLEWKQLRVLPYEKALPVALGESTFAPPSAVVSIWPHSPDKDTTHSRHKVLSSWALHKLHLYGNEFCWPGPTVNSFAMGAKRLSPHWICFNFFRKLKWMLK
jgi:hypothetical protein